MLFEGTSERTSASTAEQDTAEIEEERVTKQITKSEMATEEEKIAEAQRRYRLCAGRILVARDQVPVAADGEYVASKVVTAGGQEVAILGTQERGQINQAFEPWGQVLLIGNRYKPGDYRPDVKIGQRVFFSPTGARDLELVVGEEKMTVTMIPFEAVVMVDTGEKVDA